MRIYHIVTCNVVVLKDNGLRPGWWVAFVCFLYVGVVLWGLHFDVATAGEDLDHYFWPFCVYLEYGLSLAEEGCLRGQVGQFIAGDQHLCGYVLGGGEAEDVLCNLAIEGEDKYVAGPASPNNINFLFL